MLGEKMCCGQIDLEYNQNVTVEMPEWSVGTEDDPPSGEVREALGADAELARVQLGKSGEGFCRKEKIRQLERETDREAERGREKGGREEIL